MARDLGEPTAVSTVRVPGVEEEDRKRLLRERRRLIKKRTMTTNAIRGLLMLHGIHDLNPRSKRFAEELDTVRTGYGTSLPPGVHGEICRATRLLELVEEQIAEVEAERDRIVERARDRVRQDAAQRRFPVVHDVARLANAAQLRRKVPEMDLVPGRHHREPLARRPVEVVCKQQGGPRGVRAARVNASG